MLRTTASVVTPQRSVRIVGDLRNKVVSEKSGAVVVGGSMKRRMKNMKRMKRRTRMKRNMKRKRKTPLDMVVQSESRLRFLG